MSKHLLKIFFLLMLFPLLVDAQGDVSAGVERQLDSIFGNYENKPGIAIAVVQNGKTLLQKGYGLANLEYEIPITRKTLFDTASNSKQFTAACVFLLEQEGKLHLDDPIQKYLPEIPDYNSTITIKNLLYHTSGLRSFFATLHSKNAYWGDSFDNEDVIEVLRKHKNLNFSPGSRHYYSNTNYILLANIIEKASGMSLSSYAKEKVFDPLGMHHTFFKEKRDTVVKNMAIGYEPEGNYFKQNHSYNATVVGSGGLYTTIEDFTKWNNNLKSGTVGGDRFIKRMTSTGSLSNGDDTNYAGGLFVENHYDIDGLPTIRHSGEWAGFRSLYYKFLNQDMAFIIMSNNADTNVWVLLDELVPLFLENEITNAQQNNSNSLEPQIETVTLTTKEKEEFSGKYYSTLNGYLREIKLEENRLMYYRPGADGTPLVATNANELVYERAPQVRFTFNRQNKESMDLSINGEYQMSYQKYNEHAYKTSELKQFENHYYSEDIDEIFQIIALEDELQLLVKGDEVVRFHQVTNDLFTSEHSGYISFERNKNNTITGFTRYDDHLYNLKHTVVKETNS